MDYRFLCPTHASQLSMHLEAVAPVWSSWMRRGDEACARAEHDVAIPYFGCACDLAVMLVERFSAHGELEGRRHIDRLLQSSSRLARALARCGHLSLRREYLRQLDELLYGEQLRLPSLAERLPSGGLLDEGLYLLGLSVEPRPVARH